LKKDLGFIYRRLYSYFGPQRWWPAQSPFEVIVGAILTQNTSWLNVEKAIGSLKERNLLKPCMLYSLPEGKLAKVIKPAGYYNIKAKRLKNFLKFFIERYQGNINRMALASAESLRKELLEVNGIGPETADSVLLYALNKPVFVVDAYTKRILFRHGLIKEDSNYDKIQEFFTRRLKKDTKLFNEYHALLVRLGKEFCLKKKPKCSVCPIKL
jgi:endonuclease-3 related protein